MGDPVAVSPRVRLRRDPSANLPASDVLSNGARPGRSVARLTERRASSAEPAGYWSALASAAQAARSRARSCTMRASPPSASSTESVSCGRPIAISPLPRHHDVSIRLRSRTTLPPPTVTSARARMPAQPARRRRHGTRDAWPIRMAADGVERLPGARAPRCPTSSPRRCARERGIVPDVGRAPRARCRGSSAVSAR